MLPRGNNGDSHVSRDAVTDALQRPTREYGEAGYLILRYLVLLQVGFTLPLLSPEAR